MGLTIVDSLDTLIILGLMEEYTEARYWVANHLDLNQGSVSVSLQRSLSVGWAVRCAGWQESKQTGMVLLCSFTCEGGLQRWPRRAFHHDCRSGASVLQFAPIAQ